jgi:hypothetical protein
MYILCKVDDPNWNMMRRMRVERERRYGLKETQGEVESMEVEGRRIRGSFQRI